MEAKHMINLSGVWSGELNGTSIGARALSEHWFGKEKVYIGLWPLKLFT
jgi:hypothetical protein